MERAKKIGKVLLKILAVLFVLCAIAIFFGGRYMVNYAIGRDSDSGNRNVEKKVESTDTTMTAESENSIGQAFANNTKYEEMSITSAENLKLNARLYEKGGNNYAILVHGYKSDMSSMYSYAKRYYDKGFNVLLVNLRAHGSSEGKYIGMGWLDRKDILQWIDTLTYRNPDAHFVLHGVSMGAATVMMTSGESVPSSLKAIISDCGYTSAYDIFELELEKRFPMLPTHPTIDIGSVMSDILASYSFKEASALEQVKNSSTPTLFIHGTGDDFVPCEMVDELYDAAACPKELYKVEGAGHCEAKNVNPAEYFDKVFGFIDKYIK